MSAQVNCASVSSTYRITRRSRPRGGTVPYTWSLLGPGDYAESDPGPGYLGGGSAQDWREHHRGWLLPLPWPFPFYDGEHTSVYVCTSGFLDFAFSNPHEENTQAGLLSNLRIAPLWDDISTCEGDVYVLEVNTIPGLTERSLLPKAAFATGICFEDLCIQCIDLAHRRKGSKNGKG